MLKNKPEYYDTITETIAAFFYRQYFVPLIAIIDKPKVKLNAGASALISAIQSGKVQYKDGVFSGQFNIKISRELSTFSKFDQRSKTWKGNPPPEIKAASLLAEGKRKDLTNKLKKELDALESKVSDAIKSAPFGDAIPLEKMGNDIREDLKNIGVMPTIDPRTAEKLRKDYTESQRLNIQNWNPEQVIRLREMVQKYQTTGTEESLLDMIQKEWGTSAAKAQFLARQETGLFFESLSRNRAAGTGVRSYKWSTSHDERVRSSHKHLQGEIFDINGEGGVVDLKTGRRAHAGADYNCRCGKIWVLD